MKKADVVAELVNAKVQIGILERALDSVTEGSRARDWQIKAANDRIQQLNIEVRIERDRTAQALKRLEDAQLEIASLKRSRTSE